MLLARDVGEGGGAAWDGPTCERTAHGPLCTWTSATATLTLQARDDGSVRFAPPVTGAWFRTADGAVAQWPLATAEEAANTQVQVDAGHSPWMTDPVAVVTAWATSQLGFTDPVVQATAPTFSTYRAIDTATGVAVDVTLGQPARAGDGGIWAVVSVDHAPARRPTDPAGSPAARSARPLAGPQAERAGEREPTGHHGGRLERRPAE